jgi:hypothetical protein
MWWTSSVGSCWARRFLCRSVAGTAPRPSSRELPRWSYVTGGPCAAWSTRPGRSGLARAYLSGDLDVAGDLYAALTSPDGLPSRPELHVDRRALARLVGPLLRLGVLELPSAADGLEGTGRFQPLPALETGRRQAGDPEPVRGDAPRVRTMPGHHPLEVVLRPRPGGGTSRPCSSRPSPAQCSNSSSHGRSSSAARSCSSTWTDRNPRSPRQARDVDVLQLSMVPSRTARPPAASAAGPTVDRARPGGQWRE